MLFPFHHIVMPSALFFATLSFSHNFPVLFNNFLCSPWCLPLIFFVTQHNSCFVERGKRRGEKRESERCLQDVRRSPAGCESFLSVLLFDSLLASFLLLFVVRWTVYRICGFSSMTCYHRFSLQMESMC